MTTSREGVERTQYLTFRTLTEDSTGWWIPARPGTGLAPQVQRVTSPAVRDLVTAAAHDDIVALLQDHLGGTP